MADRITFTGLLPREEVFQALRSADCYLSPSTLEGLPISVLEAMYCGLPCVLSDIPQHRELAGDYADGYNGLTLLPPDTDRWVEAIHAMTVLSPRERAAVSAGNRDYVTRSFSLENMHGQYDALYRLLGR